MFVLVRYSHTAFPCFGMQKSDEKVEGEKTVNGKRMRPMDDEETAAVSALIITESVTVLQITNYLMLKTRSIRFHFRNYQLIPAG